MKEKFDKKLRPGMGFVKTDRSNFDICEYFNIVRYCEKEDILYESLQRSWAAYPNRQCIFDDGTGEKNMYCWDSSVVDTNPGITFYNYDIYDFTKEPEDNGHAIVDVNQELHTFNLCSEE